MLAVTRLLPPDDALDPELVRAAVTALAERPGCRSVTLARAVDDPRVWVLVSSWESVGAYRRALSHHDVKLNTVPLLHHAVDEPGAFEELTTWTPCDGIRLARSDRAGDDPGWSGGAPADNPDGQPRPRR